MSNWIYGKDLIEHWDIEDFELFGFLKKGLQPYDKLGRKVIDSDSLEWDRKRTPEYCENLVRGTQETGKVFTKSRTSVRLTEQEIKQQGKELFENQPLEILNPPKDSPYMSFSLPSNEKEATKAIASVKYFRFKKDEASEFAKKTHHKLFDYYQHLNLTELKIMAQGWANRFSVIKQITLYRADRDGKHVLDVRIDDSDKIEYRKFKEGWIDKDCYLDRLRDVYKEPTEPYGDWLFLLPEVGGEPLSEDDHVLTDSRLILFPRDDVDEADLSELQKHANVFHLYGDNWKVKYKGDETTLRNLERVRYVVYLLKNPTKGFYPIDLTRLVKGNSPNTNKDYSTMGEEQLEEEGISLVDLPLEKLSKDDKSKLENVVYNCREKLNAAKKLNNEKQIKTEEKRWDDTRSHLLNEYGVKIIDTSTGLKFKFLNRLKDDQEKARSNVTKHIKNAISDIKKKLPSLGKHLDKHIKTGLKCSYGVDPETLPIWDIHWNN